MKVAADTKLYDLEKRAIQIDIDKHEHENDSDNTDDNSSLSADDNSSHNADDNTQPIKVSHVQSPIVKNTMLIMMIIHCVRWFTDQHMYIQ